MTLSTIVILVLTFSNLSSLTTAKTFLKKERSYIHFEQAGQMRGIAINGGISLEVDVKPYFKSLYKTCEGFKKTSEARANLTHVERRNIQMMLNTALENCIQESRTLTHTLSAWLTEEEIIKHPLLTIEDSIYGRRHRSMAAPLSHHVTSYGTDHFYQDDYVINGRSSHPHFPAMDDSEYSNNLNNLEEYDDVLT